jgi:nucleotide-binding universal stress UspA family protein
MYKHILIATDGSDLARKAVTHGLALAKALGTRVTVVTVTEPLATLITGDVIAFPAEEFPAEEYERAVTQIAQTILSGVIEVANKQGIACETVHEKDQFPAEGIIHAAKSRGCDLIVMASHGRRGLSKVLLGSQATQVLTHTTTPVLVYR